MPITVGVTVASGGPFSLLHHELEWRNVSWRRANARR